MRVQPLPRGEEEGDVGPRFGGVVGGRDVNLYKPLRRAVRHARRALEELEEIGGEVGVIDLDSHMHRQRKRLDSPSEATRAPTLGKSRLCPPKDRDAVQPRVSPALDVGSPRVASSARPFRASLCAARGESREASMSSKASFGTSLLHNAPRKASGRPSRGVHRRKWSVEDRPQGVVCLPRMASAGDGSSRYERVFRLPKGVGLR